MTIRLYRPHRGCFQDSLRGLIEVSDFAQLVRAMRREVEAWYPKDELPTEESTTIETYYPHRDDRIGWEETYLVCVNGQAWGFINGKFD